MPPLHVLLVEDNPTDVILVEASLEEMTGFEPDLTVCERLGDAAAALNRQKYDVVLLDLSLPDGQGVENVVKLTEAAPLTPIIVLTGLADEAIALEALKRGGADYLIKGGTDARLLERSVRYAIERKRNENNRLELAGARIARAEAEAANRSKDEFLATLSHELRTPLNAILGWASLLKTGGLGPADTVGALETIERNARVQAQLIEDLLDVSRIITGNFRLRLASVTAESVVQAAVEATAHAADAKRIRIRLQLEDVPSLCCDATRMQQVLWNLLSNAIKFSPAGGTIVVSITRSAGPGSAADGTATEPDQGAGSPDGLKISVCDSGQGITPEFLPHVFERFRQADATSTRRHGGLGLGLNIVRHLVEMHGGAVWAASEGLGKGSTFTVWLPLGKAEDCEETPRPDATLGAPVPAADGSLGVGTEARNPAQLARLLRGVRILAVDDDLDSREFFRRSFEATGASIRVAASAEEALGEYPGFAPELVICDLGLPGLDGFGFLDRLRHSYRGADTVPALAITASSGQEERALAAGFQACVSKPISSEALTQLVAALYFGAG